MATGLTDHQLDEIEARINAATPGPWAVSEDYSDVLTPDGDQLASYWNPTAETRNGEFIAHAREDVPALVADLRQARDRVAELEVGLNDLAALVSQWHSRAEKAETRVAELDAAPGKALATAADVVDRKLTAEPDHNRASALYELLLELRAMQTCTCARSQGLHEKSCRKYVPGHELLSPVNALAAYRAERTNQPAA